MNGIDLEQVPELLKKAIQDSGLTENKFSAVCGVSQNVINRIVHKVNTPSHKTLKKLWPFILQYQKNHTL